MKKGSVAYIYTGRYGGSDLQKITRQQFKDWRDRINQHRGESFNKEGFTQQEVNLMSQLLATLGFKQMSKDIKNVKTDEEFLKYLAITRRNMVQRLSSNPDNKDKVQKVIDYTDKIARSVQSR